MVFARTRVGSAYVAVDARFQPASLKKVGKQIEAQLSRIATRNGKLYRSLGSDMVTAWRGALGAIVTGAPLMGSLISGLTGGVTMLAGAFWSTATAASAALPLLTSVGLAAGTAKIAFEGFGGAVSAADPEALAEALEKLSPAAGASALAVRSLSDEATTLRLAVQESFFAGLSDDIERLGTTLMPVATEGFSLMGSSLNGLAQSVLDYTNSFAGISVINSTFKNSASIIETLSGAVVPFLDGFLRLVNALSPAAQRLAGRISDIATRFQEWTQAEGFAARIDEGMQKAEKTAGLLFDVIGNLGSAIGNIFDAANPSTNTFLEMLGDVTERFKEFTESVGGQESIAKWAGESVGVLESLGGAISAVFEVLQDLADPRIISSFLETVENAFTILGDLPLEALVSGFADMAEALQPISGPMLAIIVAGVSLQMMFGSLLGQMAGAAGVMGVLKGGLDRLKGGFAGLGGSAGKHASSFGKFSSVLGKLGGILAKGLKFAGLAGLAVTIVTVISKSEDLQNKLKAAWESVKGVFESLGSAFSGVSSAASPLLSTLEPVFALFERIVGIGVGLVLDTIKFAFDSLGKAIEGAGTFISGFLTVLNGIFTLDFGMILEGLRTAFSGIPALLEGLFGLFITFFAPAKLLGLGARFFGGLLTGIRSAFPGILSGIGGLISQVLSFFVSLGPRLLSIGGSAIRGLGSGISAGFTFVRGVVSSAMTGIRTVFTTIWNGIKSVVTTVWNAIKSTISTVLNTVKSVITTTFNFYKTIITNVLNGIKSTVTSVWNGIKSTISTVVNSIKSAITTGFNAIKSTISTVLNTVKSVVTTVWNAIKSTISTVMNTVKSVVTTAWNTIKSTISTALGTIKSTITTTWNTVKSLTTTAWNTVKSTISTAWTNIKSAVSTGISEMITLIKGVPGRIVRGLGNLGNLLLGAGKDIMSGLVKGIEAGFSWVSDKLSWVTSKLPDWKGPPEKDKKILAKSGELVMGGFVKSLDAGAQQVRSNLRDLTRDISRSSFPPISISPLDQSVSGSTMARVGAQAGASSSGQTVTNHVTNHVTVEVDLASLKSVATLEDFLKMLDVRTTMTRGVGV